MIDDFGIKRIDLGTFSGIFSDTTNSYKFLFFLALLDIAKDNANDAPIPIIEIAAGMLYWAWYPHTQHRLSFGARDQVTKVLDDFISETRFDLQPKDAKRTIRTFLESNPAHVDRMTRYVPYRFIRPFTGSALVGIPDAQVNQAVRERSAEYLYENAFPYAIGEQGLVFNRYWLHYFQTHFAILQSWVSWHWVRYMQKANPSVPAIPAKIHPMLKREQIKREIKAHWKGFVMDSGLKCIFSGRKILPDGIHLDHFMPWKFVVHNEMWNLMPIDPSENSSKSDRIPAMKRFLKPFADVQHDFLLYLDSTLTERKFNKRTESYVLNLNIEPAALLDRKELFRSYRAQMEPLERLALNQGFQPYSPPR